MTELDRIIAEEGVTANYQPIVSLVDARIVGYEALARGPKSSSLEFPDKLFEAAREADRLNELEAECLRAAFAGAGAIKHPAALFINVEPEGFEGPPEIEDVDATVIVEITERGLATRPAELMLAVEKVRRRGWGIAVDDVGADWRSMALLPFLRPDVVKLDRGVMANPADPDAARTVRGARAYIERQGGMLLAEGIEEQEHERRAMAFGARLGQGWLYGRPAPLKRSAASTDRPGIPIVQQYEPIASLTPFETVRASGLPTGLATKGELLPISIDLEREATVLRDPAVVLATFQNAERFGGEVRERYSSLASGAAFVAAFGIGLAPEPAPGVRGARIEDGETLAGEWTVIVVGPNVSLALIARDLGDTGADGDRRFEYVLIEDRDLILCAGRALMLRIAAEPPFRAIADSFREPSYRPESAPREGVALGGAFR